MVRIHAIYACQPGSYAYDSQGAHNSLHRPSTFCAEYPFGCPPAMSEGSFGLTVDYSDSGDRIVSNYFLKLGG